LPSCSGSDVPVGDAEVDAVVEDGAAMGGAAGTAEPGEGFVSFAQAA